MEHQANLLWIPLESDYNVKQVYLKLILKCTFHLFLSVVQEWLDQNFQSNSRDEIMLFGSKNVLTPESLKEVIKVGKQSKINTVT